jgi:hypothetical protein
LCPHNRLPVLKGMWNWTRERYLRKEDSLPRPSVIATEGVTVNTIGRRP